MFLKPAVSIRLSLKPSSSTDVWMISLVVPALEFTIETFLFAIRLMRVLLPTLGLPMITTLTPSLRILRSL